MTEILANLDEPPIYTIEDVIDYYVGAPDNPALTKQDVQLGIEIEKTAYYADTLEPLTQETCEEIIDVGRSRGFPMHFEPSATLVETITDPFPRDDLGALLEQADRRFNEVCKLGRDHGVAFSSFGHLPHIRYDQHHPIENERYRAFWVPYRDDMRDAYRSFLYPGIQVSISYKDWDQLLRIIRLCVVLEPLMFLTTDASAPFFEGEKSDINPWMDLKNKRGPNGGIPEFYYTARDGEDLIRAHIQHTLSQPYLFAHFGFDGKLHQIPSGERHAYLDLEQNKLGPCNMTNYRQAQSESWRRACNIATINDKKTGEIRGHRAELNIFSSGLQHQRGTALMMSHLIAFCDHFYPNIKSLLHDFGISLEDLQSSREALETNFQEALHHKERYHTLPFGTRTLKDFAQEFAALTRDCFKNNPHADLLQPMLHILNEGRPDWLVYREQMQTLDDCKTWLRELPERLARDSRVKKMDACADSLF